jgi:ABC-type iron transport system FetAB ATPase subunit
MTGRSNAPSLQTATSGSMPAAGCEGEPVNFLLAARGLGSSFGGPFDLDLALGECVCVLGKSGSGKSVFLRLVADMDAGLGTVTLKGKSRDDWTGPEWRQRVIYQAAEPAWWALTGAEHFRPEDREQMVILMRALGLDTALLAHPVEQLSTGERQRLALVRSLARNPEVLLLDEPTASLDQASTLAVEDLLASRMNAGLGIVIVTHSREQAQRMGMRRFEMRDHRLHAL